MKLIPISFLIKFLNFFYYFFFIFALLSIWLYHKNLITTITIPSFCKVILTFVSSKRELPCQSFLFSCLFLNNKFALTLKNHQLIYIVLFIPSRITNHDNLTISPSQKYISSLSIKIHISFVKLYFLVSFMDYSFSF